MKLVCGECGREVQKLIIILTEGGRKIICGVCFRRMKREVRKAAS